MRVPNKHRILYLISHPIQYQMPLLRLIAQQVDFDLSVLFYWNKKTDVQFDVGFGQAVQWDVPLLSGYCCQYLNVLAHSQSTLRKLKALWRAIHKNKIDIVWTHGYTDIYTFAAIVIAKLKGLKVFVRGESLLFPDEKNSRLQNLKRKLFFKFLDKCVNSYLAIGENNKKFYLSFGVPEHKIFVCHYTVDNDFFHEKYIASKKTSQALKTKLGLSDDHPIILYASKFIKRKHAMDLLKAYIQLSQDNAPSNAHLLFIGTGEEYTAVKFAAEQTHWKSIRFLGFKNQTELPNFYAIADIFVLPSQRENWGLVVNEAMNAECAIIASDHVGCAADLVRHGVNGYIYPVRDVNALSRYLEILISNRDQRAKMKRKSLERIAEWGLQQSLAGLRVACHSLW